MLCADFSILLCWNWVKKRFINLSYVFLQQQYTSKGFQWFQRENLSLLSTDTMWINITLLINWNLDITKKNRNRFHEKVVQRILFLKCTYKGKG